MHPLKNKMNSKQFNEIKKDYARIRKYLIGSIATTVTLIGITLGVNIATNHRIDNLYQQNNDMLKELMQYRLKIEETGYKLNSLEKKSKTYILQPH